MVTTRLTYQDYANLEGDERYELLDGELIPVTSPDEDHQTASLRMIVRMNAFVDENDLGRVFHAPYDVLFTDTDIRPARPAVCLKGEIPHQDSGQYTGSAGPGSGDSVALLIQTGLAR